MKHSFRVKSSVFKSVYENKLRFRTLVIDNKQDAYDCVDTILNFAELNNVLIPTNCSYNFISNQIEFGLELKEGVEKKTFFEAIKSFEEFMEL